ncbi:MAG: DUF2520 domain-containing protein [Thermoanaerobaculum sp.]
MEAWLIVGAGRVGLQLARHMAELDLPFWLLCRSQERLHQAAALLPETRLLTRMQGPVPARRVLLAVRDREVVGAARELAPLLPPRGVVLHCSGALGPEALRPLGLRAALGVFHPLLPFPHPVSPRVELAGAVVTVAGDDGAVAAGRELAQALGMVPMVCPHLDWPLYHGAAALAGPMVYALFRLACSEMARAGFPRDTVEKALLPLAQAALAQAARARGFESLTGPLVRGDSATVEAHLAALSGDAQGVYRALAKAVAYALSAEPAKEPTPNP